MDLVRSLLAYFLCLIVLLAATSRHLLAEDQKYDGMPVINIRFDPPVQPLEGSELFEILPLKRGQPLRMAVVRESIDRLFATGRYADIQVDISPYNGGGVIVTFITKNSWFIGDVSVAGKVAEPPNPGQLANASRLELGQPYTDRALDVAITAQRRLLETNGLYLSTIRPVFDYDTTHQQINIRFEINSGKRAHFGPPVLLGDLKMDPRRIMTATKFRRWIINTWKPVTQVRVREGLDSVRALYQKENRLEAKVVLESMKFEPELWELIPTLNIDAGPHIQVNTVGAKVSQRKLRRYVPIFEEHAVDRDLLVEGANNLRDYFQSQGYFEAQVEVVPQKVINDKANIDFLVNTGKQHKLVAVSITGNHYFSTDVIRERMFLQTARILQFPHGRYSESLLRRDKQTIVNLYESNGFRDVKVTSRSVDDEGGKVNNLAVYIYIEEGPQYLVGHVQVEGVEKLDRSRVLSKLSSVEGQPFSEFNVAVDRDTILAQYFDRGFPHATFDWTSKAGAEPHRIDLMFTIHEGQQQFVREVIVTGLKTTKPSLVSRNLRLNPGDPLSPTAITDTQRRLYDLGIFAKVDGAIENPDGETARKYVLFNVEEAARYSVAVGLGAELGRIGGCQTCLDAPAGQTGFSGRVSLDVTRNNIWGLGHSLSLRTRVSTLERRGLLTYTWPRFRSLDHFNLTFNALYDDSRDVRTFSSKRLEGSVQLSQRFSKATTFFYRYTYRRVSVDEATLKISPFLINLLSQPVRVGILSFAWVQDRRDDPVDPHKGIYSTVDIGLAEGAFGSERNFMRVLARNATYHPLGKRLVLARSLQIGDIYGFNNQGDPANAIPLPERFFGGGGTSHRGFPENQAGPRDLSTGFPLGGTALLFNQTELRFPLIGDNISGVGFHDFGNIYSSSNHFSLRQTQRDLSDFDYMVHAVGFGIRYRTPVGPLRVDLGYSINPPKFFGYKGTQQDLLNAGRDPCLNSNKCVVQSVSHFQYFFSIGQTF
ncbi:MAG: surface antigen [Candidatus Solibacter sp.]|nr:surface antigen [Candidatus Solibacter sp.]